MVTERFIHYSSTSKKMSTQTFERIYEPQSPGFINQHLKEKVVGTIIIIALLIRPKQEPAYHRGFSKGLQEHAMGLSCNIFENSTANKAIFYIIQAIIYCVFLVSTLLMFKEQKICCRVTNFQIFINGSCCFSRPIYYLIFIISPLISRNI